MALPLEGIRVVELAAWMAGPACAAVLSDWGAEVIKMEHPERGDPLRGILSIGVIPVGAVNYLWELDNRNKKSLGLDLKHPRGHEVALRLLDASDVFVTNLQGSELKRLGLDYESLSPARPRLVYAHITGYGELGPHGDRPGFDLAAWARSGFMLTLGEPDSIPPLSPTGNIDRITAMFTAGAIALALYVREKTGQGQKVSSSLLASALWTGGVYTQAASCTRREIPRPSRKTAGNPLYNSYQTQDGRWLVLIMLQTDLYWQEFCQAIGQPELARDPRFDSHGKRCGENNQALIALLDQVFASRSLAQWVQAFQGRHVLWEPSQTYLQVTADPQVEANEHLVDFHHPSYGSGKLVSVPVKFSRTPGAIRQEGPQLGQHTEEVLLELGYSWEEIARLKEAGAIL